ncbi:hypothetical protein B1729_12895 [Microbacterium sp. B35-04]|uniref:hypothetical protein n=1 Tax=unclassified Microbacterium TaxID=2609290 RepID=UPI0013D398CE|nr:MULTISPECIES: hypothetical protein [unclassified Microbacterium]KAF2412813.1 hypothetical protein B1729_12895 [Microbacterium sp. B35-04]KAF2415944.1 hypothetical protein B2K11_18085 [Microbacterium sp. B35-30]
MVSPDVLLVAVLSIFLFVALCGALVLVVLSLRKPTDIPLIVAGVLVVLCLLAVTVSPVNVPLLLGLGIALLGTALAVLGGNPVTRRVLDIASHGRVEEGDNGGILLRAPSLPGAVAGEGAVREVMRGGTTIGYLERVAVALGIIAGFPEAIAVVVALKGIGRFSELASAEARERFIIGTLASLVWACIVAALVRLAIW